MSTRAVQHFVLALNLPVRAYKLDFRSTGWCASRAKKPPVGHCTGSAAREKLFRPALDGVGAWHEKSEGIDQGTHSMEREADRQCKEKCRCGRSLPYLPIVPATCAEKSQPPCPACSKAAPGPARRDSQSMPIISRSSSDRYSTSQVCPE